MAEILPKPILSGALKLSYGTTVTVTYDGSPYDAVFSHGDSYDSAYHLMWALIDKIEADGCPSEAVALHIDEDGFCHIGCDVSPLVVSEAIDAGGSADEKVLSLLGFDPAGLSGSASYESDTPPYRVFCPNSPAMRRPEFTRTLNPARASWRRTVGGVQGVTTLAPHGGHVAARITLQIYEDITKDTDQQRLHRFLTWLSGRYLIAEDIDDGGDGWLVDWSGAAEESIDALGSGGVCEVAFAYFERWEDWEEDYQATSTYAAFRSAQDEYTVYYLHPDLTEMQITQRWDGVSSYWITEFDVLEAP